jgi:hypothetical protein
LDIDVVQNLFGKLQSYPEDTLNHLTWMINAVR